MNRHTIRRIYVWPAFKFGAIIGAVLLLIPGIINGLLVRAAIEAIRPFVETMGTLGPLGAPGAADTAQQLQNLLTMGPLMVVWSTLLTVLIGGLACGIGAALAALVYNLVAGMGGGLALGVEVQGVPQAAPLPQQPLAPQFAPAQAAPQQNQGLPRPQPQIIPAAQPPASYAPPAAQAAPSYQPAAPVAQAAPVIQPSGPWLSLSSNPAQRLALRGDCTRLGSASDNDITLPGLAAHHAEIRLDNGVYVLYDLTPGQTWVNNRPVAGRNMLKEGFQMRLSAQDLVFHAS